MARMHSDGRGESGSSNPVSEKAPRWTDYDEKEVKELVVKLKEEGLSPSEIGLKLRDTYGIPSVKTLTGMKVTDILEEEGVADDMPEDLQNLLEKADSMADHLDDNPNDLQTERRLELTEAKIRRLANYHRENGNIPEDWSYER
ncbi:MAG: 30S ribosomal protein S15 [Candidatus Nanohaloarchaea archaeon]